MRILLTVKTLIAAGALAAVSAAAVQAQVANPNETEQSQKSGAAQEPGKDKLGGTMPNAQVPAMSPDAPQSSTAGTTMGPDGKLERNSGSTSEGAGSGTTGSGTKSMPETSK